MHPIVHILGVALLTVAAPAQVAAAPGPGAMPDYAVEDRETSQMRVGPPPVPGGGFVALQLPL